MAISRLRVRACAAKTPKPPKVKCGIVVKKTCFVVTLTTSMTMLIPKEASASIEIPHSLAVAISDASYFAGRSVLMFATLYFGLNWWTLWSTRRRMEEDEDKDENDYM